MQDQYWGIGQARLVQGECRVTDAEREHVCEAVHKLLEHLPALRGKPGADLPTDGIYFWYERGESRRGQGLRVTRVGTHETSGRLRARIREHFGSNREGSVFRKHVGAALMARDGEPDQDMREWGEGRNGERFHDEKFKQYERRVTEQTANGVYRVLKVDDMGERLEFEEKLIALFSHCRHCRPSPHWLGNWAVGPKIREAGLWNVQHVCAQNEFQSRDLGRLEKLVQETLRLNRGSED